MDSKNATCTHLATCYNAPRVDVGLRSTQTCNKADRLQTVRYREGRQLDEPEVRRLRTSAPVPLYAEVPMSDRPTFRKWTRKTGGFKVCGACGRKHKPVIRVGNKTPRVKVCVQCGADLPSKLTYPKKSSVTWYVREFDPSTGKMEDHRCRSSEAADEFIRRKQRDYTPDPIQEQLLEFASTVIRQIEAPSYDEAVNQLIVKLGGDATARSLKPIGWDEAREIICDELRQKGRSEMYITDVLRVTSDFGVVTGLTDWSRVDLESVAKYRSIRMAGGWKRGGRVVKAVAGRAINKDLATLSAFLTRAVRKGWAAQNALENAPDERIKVKAVRVDYMPDDDLRALIAAADGTWLQALVIVAYYTGARRGDLLRLEWGTDVDFDGSKVASEGRAGPHIFIQGNKADTPHWMPLHPIAVRALENLRRKPVIDQKVFPVRGTINPASRVSHLFAELCLRAGLSEQVERDGEIVTKNKWTLHDLRRKANTDLRNRGASAKERATLLGHRTTVVNEAHYEAIVPTRERELIDALPVFGATA